MAIVDAAGNTVVEYKYDPWGKPIGDASQTEVGTLNPFRYRGYVWDDGTGLCYLRSRYYQPSLCRMLNIDQLFAMDGLNLGHNLYLYCRNSPVNLVDPGGAYAIPFAKAACAFLLGILIPAIGQAWQNKKRTSSSTSRRISNKSSLKSFLSFASIAIGTTYSSIKDRVQERAEERDRITAITNQYRIDGAPYFDAILSDEGIIIFGDPLSFEVAFEHARKGQNVWTDQAMDMLKLAQAVATAYGYSVTKPEKGSRYRECWHFHLMRGKQKHPTHFFFGYENVVWY